MVIMANLFLHNKTKQATGEDACFYPKKPASFYTCPSLGTGCTSR